jgi:hypothetical protein
MKNDTVMICHNDNCISANGQNAKIIATGAFVLLLFLGVSALSKGK